MSFNEDDCPTRFQFMDSREWETLYREAVLASKDLINDEQLRRLQLNMLIQEYQKKDFIDQILTKDITLSTLEQECKNLSVKLVEVEEKASQQEKCLQSHKSDLMKLRAGLRSLSKISTQPVDQTAGISCISNELTTLKYEIENLRAIATSYENIQEENLVLRQKLDLLENNSVGLNYVSQLDLHKDKHQADLEDKIIRKNQDMEQKEEHVISELAEEEEHPPETTEDVILNPQGLQEEITHEENQKRSDIKLLNTLQELELIKNRQSALENELRKMHEKVADYEIQKNNLQAKYDKSQALLCSLKLSAIEKQPDIKHQLKRDLRRKNTDASIGTPGGVATRATRNSVNWGCTTEQASIGEKSIFSITPFLNRTLDIEKEFSGSEDEDFIANDAQKMSKNHISNDPTISHKKIYSSNQGFIKYTSKERPKIKSQRVKRTKSDCLESLEKVIEEVNDDVLMQEKKEIATLSSSSILSKVVAPKSQIQKVDENDRRKQKNKRTLLKAGVMNLENEGIELPSSEIEADYQAHRSLKKGVFPILHGGIGEKSSTFSPLKKDRARRDKNIVK